METVLRGQRSTAIVSSSVRSKQVFCPWWCRQRPFRRVLQVGSRGCFTGIPWQKTSKNSNYCPLTRSKSHLWWGVWKIEVDPEFAGWSLMKRLTIRWLSFLFFSFCLLMTLVPGPLKTRVNHCFYCSNSCRRAYFALSMQSNAPTKLRIFLDSLLFSMVFWVRREE